MRTALVFAGGDRPPPSSLDGLLPADVIIAADSGLGHALALGCRVDLVVGDLDSADPADLERAAAAGSVIERHPVAKDTTDLALALDAARARGVDRIVVIGGHGGRLDHFLANALALTAPALEGIHVEARMGDAVVLVVRDRVEILGAAGDLCSLLPIGGVARRVTTEGLRFPLRAEDLEPGSTRGVSNEFVTSRAQVSLTDGVLLAILPQTGKVAS
jgi:thiamine pyrophosphokinase